MKFGSEFQFACPNWFKSISLVQTDLNLWGRERHIWNANENAVILTLPNENSDPAVNPHSFDAVQECLFMDHWQLFPVEGCWFSGKRKWLSSFSLTLLVMIALSLSAVVSGSSLLWLSKMCYHCWMTDSDPTTLHAYHSWKCESWLTEKYTEADFLCSVTVQVKETKIQNVGSRIFFIVLGTCTYDFESWGCSQNEPQIFCPQQAFITLALIDGFRELEPEDKSLMDH